VSVTICCVLRSGGDFSPAHVERLATQIHLYSPGDCPVVCLTDMVPEIEALGICDALALQDFWPGFWSKMEVFRLAGPVLYLDLDTTIVGPLDPLLAAVRQHELIVGRDFQSSGRRTDTSVMGWSTGLRWLYYDFAASAYAHQEIYSSTEHFVRDRGPPAPMLWQSILPGHVLSYREVQNGADMAEARVIVSHGTPGPSCTAAALGE
jgi:hypothetical protein